MPARQSAPKSQKSQEVAATLPPPEVVAAAPKVQKSPKPAPPKQEEEEEAAAAPKVQKPQRERKPAPPKQVEEEDEYASLLEASNPQKSEQPADYTKLFSLSQYMDKLKETHKNIKQFDVFIFADNRTELRTETSKAGKEYQRYIVQPLLVNAISADGKPTIITRKSLIAEFGKHYLTLFYSKFDVPHADFQINIIQIDGKPKINGEYTDYRYRIRAIDNAAPVAAKLIDLFSDLDVPVVKAYVPRTIQEFDYANMEIEIGDDDCA
jgi:hypothetical protein